MDKAIWLDKRKNLLNSSKKSPEIFITKNFVDLLSLFSERDLINFIENEGITELKINKQELSNHIKALISEANDINTLNNVLQILNITIDSTISIEQKEKLINKIINDKLELIDQLLNYSITSKVDYYDSSIWSFYLSCGLLEGVISYVGHEDLIVRAPLINMEIEVYKNENGEIVLHKYSEIRCANDILELAVDDQIEKSSLISNGIEQINFNCDTYFQSFRNIFPNLVIDIKASSMKFITKEEMQKNNSGLKISKTFFASLINPIGAKILRDFDFVINDNYEFPIYNSIFHKDLNHLIYDEDAIHEINNPLNLIQKLAIVNSQNKNILIYGPPGTGKSEVVANLIANLLLLEKKVIVISEKKAALDVLDTRLLSLNTLAISAFNDKNSQIFFDKILEINHLIVASNKVQIKLTNKEYLVLLQYQKEFKHLSEYIDINKNSIYDFIKKYESLDFNFYQRHIDNIKFIFNKLNVDKLSLNQFMDDVKEFYHTQQYFENLIRDDQLPNDIYNYQRVEEFLETFKDVDVKNQKYVLAQFILKNEILTKKPMFKFKNSIVDDINVENVLSELNRIVNNKLHYVINGKKLFHFFNEHKHVVDYVSLYDWLINTNFTKMIDLISGGELVQNIIRQYWIFHKMYAKKNDELIRDFVVNHLKEKLLNNHELEKQWTEVVRIANLTKKPNVNKIIKDYYNILKQVFPIWILSPDAATSVLPLKRNEFDYGIFDEASQMRIERALPLIYRCEYNIVSGDDKQLKPSSFFSRSTALDESYIGHLDNVDSLLDKAKTSNWMSFTLNNHYRSINEQLIGFSSHYFYDDKLICITKNGEFKKAIEVINVMGKYEREKGINPEEANKIIQCLLNSLKTYKTVIVITFNIKQANFIQSLAITHHELQERIENLDIKIRSLENVQGDEAELVIISCTFGKDSDGRFIQNFGPVNQEGGKNRINVMASRAKSKMIVVKSFMSMDITNDSNENTYIFKSFISYCERFDGNNSSINKNETNKVTAKSIIEKLACELLLDNTIVIEKYKKIGSHIMDIAISKINADHISLCILLDDINENNQYARDLKTWINNVDRQKYYEDRGFNTFRTNELELKINHINVIKAIKEQII